MVATTVNVAMLFMINVENEGGVVPISSEGLRGGMEQELHERFDMALELLGERNELVESLEMDILEMKEIFHAQLQEAVDQLSALRATVGGGSSDATTLAGSDLAERMGRS